MFCFSYCALNTCNCYNVLSRGLQVKKTATLKYEKKYVEKTRDLHFGVGFVVWWQVSCILMGAQLRWCICHWDTCDTGVTAILFNNRKMFDGLNNHLQMPSFRIKEQSLLDSPVCTNLRAKGRELIIFSFRSVFTVNCGEQCSQQEDE